MKEVQIHEFCMGSEVDNEEELREWIESVID
jgi:hypothetical protein